MLTAGGVPDLSPDQRARLAAWSLGLGIVTVAALAGLFVGISPLALQAVALVAVGSGLTAVGLAVVVLRPSAAVALAARRHAFVGGVLGSLLLAYVVVLAASVVASLQSTPMASRLASSESAQLARLERACVRGETAVGRSPQAALLACAGCPASTAGSTTSCATTVHVAADWPDWPAVASVLAVWAALVTGAWWLALGRRRTRRGLVVV